MDPFAETCDSRNAEDWDFASGETVRRLSEKNAFPMGVTLEITHKCYLTCPHCYLSKQNDEKELSTDEIVGILDQLAELGVLVLTFTGGDPLIRPDLFRIVQAAVERRFVVILKTSAAVMSVDQARSMAELGVYEMNVSLYHVSKEKHDRFVGREGAWNVSVAAMREFKRAGRNVRASIMVMGWNLDAILSLEEMCLFEGWKYTLDFRITPRTDGGAEPQEYQAQARELVRLAEQSIFFRRVISRRKKDDSTLRDCLPCGMANCVVLRPNGAVIPCILLPRLVLGDARQDRIAHIWKASAGLREKMKVRWGDQPKCAACDLISDCNRCPATGFIEHGNLTTPSALECKLAKVRREARLRLQKDDG